MKVIIFYATETGNASVLAEDMAAHLSTLQDVEVIDLETATLDQLDRDAILVFVTATCGEGELPAAARQFYRALTTEQPDLIGCRFAVFGLGDRHYADTYNAGGYLIERALLSLRAKKLLRRGMHNASSSDLPEEVGKAWLDKALKKAIEQENRSAE